LFLLSTISMDNKGVHSYLTSPSFKGLFDFELHLLHYSILKWKAINGPIYLVCDKPFADYLDKEGLLSLYDHVVEMHVPFEVDRIKFWAAGKIFAYDQMGVGYHFIDMDAVIHEPIPDFQEDMMAAHFDWSPLKRRAIGLDDDRNLNGINMAFSCFKNPDLLEKYVHKAYHYMQNSKEGESWLGGWEHMVYAEQTILADIIREDGLKCAYFRDDNVPTMYHLWSGKQKIIDGDLNREDYISALKQKIEQWQVLYQVSTV